MRIEQPKRLIERVPYENTWSKQFEEEAQALRRALEVNLH